MTPQHWTPLAQLAARSTAYDRSLLGRVLGPAGLWFLRCNAAWRRLAESATAELPAEPNAGGHRVVVPETVLREPDAIFACRQPWPADLLDAALQVLARAELGAGGLAYTARLGAELPLAAYAQLVQAAEGALSQRPLPLPLQRLVWQCFVACEEAAWLRIEIGAAFTGEPPMAARQGIPPLRREGAW